MLLREKALKGDARALDRLLELAGRFNNEPGGTELAQVLSPDDRTMLADYAAEIAAPAITSTTPESASDPVSTLAASSDKKAQQ